MDRKAQLLAMASNMVDQVIRQYSHALDFDEFVSTEDRVDLYRGAYFRIEEEALAQLNLVMFQDAESLLSLKLDVDPMLRQKLQEFAFRYNPVRNNLN